MLLFFDRNTVFKADFYQSYLVTNFKPGALAAVQ